MGPTVLGITVGLAGTDLVATLGWQLLGVIVLAVPATILLFQRPLVGVALWLGLAQFVMLTHSSLGRKLYWLLHRALPPTVVLLIAFGSVHQIRARLSRLGLPELAMSGYLVTSLASVILLNDNPKSTSYLLFDRVFSPMCLYLAIRLWHPDEKDLKRLVPVILSLAMAQVLIGALSWLAPQYLPEAWLNREDRATGSLVSPSIYTVALLFSGSFLFHASEDNLSMLKRIFYKVIAMASFMFVFLTLSRAAWLAGIVVLSGLTIMYSGQVFRWSMGGLPLVLVMGVLFSDQIAIAVNQRLYSEDSLKSAASRVPGYVAGVRMFLAKPIVGWGYGNFDRYDRRFQISVAGFQDDNRDHASHNLYLTLLAEQGLVGSTLYLFPFGWWLARSFRCINNLPLQGFWSRKLLGVFWLSLFSHILVNQFSNMREGYGLGLWWLTLALVASLVDWAAYGRAKTRAED